MKYLLNKIVLVVVLLFTLVSPAAASINIAGFEFIKTIKPNTRTYYIATDQVYPSSEMSDGSYDARIDLGFYGAANDIESDDFIDNVFDVVVVKLKKQGQSTYLGEMEPQTSASGMSVQNYSGKLAYQQLLSHTGFGYVDPGKYTADVILGNAVIDSFSFCLPTFTSSTGKSIGNETCGGSAPSTPTNPSPNPAPEPTPNTANPPSTPPNTPVNTNPVPVSGNGLTVAPCTDKECYETFQGLQDALGDQFSSFNEAQDLTGFINALVGFAIGIAGVLAVGMIMYEGFLYMSTDNVTTKSTARSRIVSTTAGFLLLLCTYTLLRTINPDLLVLMPNIDGIALQTAAELSSSSFEKITGEPLGKPGSYDDLIKEAADKYNSDYCALRVIVQNETKGNPAVVGQDENVPNSGVASRRAFIASGKKYSGASFASAQKLITSRKFCNDAAGCVGKVPDPESPTLGLDWRFSKGIGLTQITFFPDDYNNFSIANYKPKESNRNVVPKRTFTFPWGETMTVSALDMFTPSKNLEVSAKLWNAGVQKCGTAKGAFYTYICGACSCQGSFAQNEVAERTSQYLSCKNP